MQNQLNIQMELLSYLPFVGLAGLVLFTLGIIFNNRMRIWFTSRYRLHVLPYSYLFLGMFGGFLGVLLSYWEINSENRLNSHSFENQLFLLTNALIITLTSILIYFPLRLFLKRNKKFYYG